MIAAVIILALISVAAAYLYITGQNKEQESETRITGIVIDKKSGKEAEGIEVLIGKIEPGKKDNSFIPFEGKKMITGKDGRFSFIYNKSDVCWVMAHGKGKKVLKPIKLIKGDVIDICLTI